jgi:cyclase
MKRGVVLLSLVVAGAAATAIVAQQPAAQQELQIEKVKDNLYVIGGNGGNTAAFITAKGVVLVDTKNPDNGKLILDKVKSVTDKPITHIINTHTHGDHVGSNMFFPATVDIVVQENTEANMKKMPVFEDPANKHGLPDRTFKDKLTLLSGDESIDLYYFGRAHTSGDAFVVFRALRVMHSGDAFAGPQLPIMDANNGGSGISYADTLSKAAKGIKNVETVIPGHSGVTPWQGFLDYGEFMTSFVSSVSAAAKGGKTPEQALAEFKPAEKFAKYGQQRGKTDVELIYKELQK